jgi:hypothetical protein
VHHYHGPKRTTLAWFTTPLKPKASYEAVAAVTMVSTLFDRCLLNAHLFEKREHIQRRQQSRASPHDRQVSTATPFLDPINYMLLRRRRLLALYCFTVKGVAPNELTFLLHRGCRDLESNKAIANLPELAPGV